MFTRLATPLRRALTALGLGALAISAMAGYGGSTAGPAGTTAIMGNTEGPFKHFPQIPKIFMPPNPKDPPKFEATQEPGYPDTNMVVENGNLLDVAASPIRTQWDAVGPNGLAPPDPVVATGPSNVVVATNDDLACYAPDGQLQFRVDVNDWLGSSDFFFDPRIAYDHYSNRWIIVYLRRRDSISASWWTVIVSDDSDLRGSFWHYNFNARLDGGTDVNQWVDFPYVGYDSTSIVLSGRMFNWGGGARYSKTRFLRKSEVYAAASASWWDFWNWQSDGSADGYVVPAEMQTNPGELFMVSAKHGGGDKLTFRRFTNTNFLGGVGPNMTSETLIPVSAYTPPPDSPQPESVQALDTVDSRLNNVQYRNGHLWTTNSSATGSGASLRSSIRVYEINTYSSPASLTRQDGLSNVSGGYFFPAISGNENNDAFVTFMHSSTSAYPTMRAVGWPAGAGLDGSAAVRTGNDSSLQLDSIGRNRWGDYAAAALDPIDNESVWMINMYGQATRSWGTHVAQTNYTKIQSTIVAANVVGELGQTIGLSATLRRDDTNAIIASRTIVFYLDDVEIGSAVTNGSGVATLNFAVPLSHPIATDVIRASFWRDNTFDGSTDTAVLTVTKVATYLTASASTGIVGEPDSLFATLRRSRDNVAIGSEPVRFTVDGTFLGTANSSAGGLAQYDWASVSSGILGIRTWTADYLGDALYLASTDTTSYTRRRRTTITSRDVMGESGFAVSVSARLIRDDGAIPVGRTVSFRVDGVAAGSSLTDINGDAAVNYVIPAAFAIGSDKVIEASFAGEDGLVASVDTSTLRVRYRTNLVLTNGTGAVGQTFTARATLRRTTGNLLLAARPVSFIIDGIGIGLSNTNLVGVAARNWVVTAGALGVRPASASYAGDGTFMPTTTTGSFTREAAKSITLQVNLQDWNPSPAGQKVQVVFSQGGVPVFSTLATLDASGKTTFNAGVVVGSATISVKGTHWLRQRKSVAIPAGAASFSFSLLNGDIDDDNAITVFDYDILSTYFDASSSDANWNTVGGNGFAPREADIDGDGAVTVFDYDILSSNFDLNGDPA